MINIHEGHSEVFSLVLNDVLWEAKVNHSTFPCEMQGLHGHSSFGCLTVKKENDFVCFKE